MSKEIINLIQELHKAGQTGLTFLLIGLLVIILLGLSLIWLQKQTISRFKELDSKYDLQIKLVNSTIAATDSFRKERTDAQNETVRSINNQFEVVIKTNDELRKEIDRINKKQDALKDKQNQLERSIKEAITIGLSDLKERITKVSVEEILHEIPLEFRNDLEGQISESAEKMVNNFIMRLKESPENIIDQNAITMTIERILSTHFEHLNLPHYLNQRLPGKYELEFLADAIAYRVFERIERRYWQ